MEKEVDLEGGPYVTGRLAEACLRLVAMTPELRSFVEGAVNSLVKLETVLFFHNNPATADTAEGVALRIYRNIEDVGPAVRELAEEAVLVETTLGSGRYVVYSLGAEEQTRRLIAELSRAYHYNVQDRMEISRLIVQLQRQRRSGREAEEQPQAP